MPEPRAPHPTEVVFVRSGSGRAAAIQEWRSTSTGRVHEVPESRCFAPAAILEDGSTGWLVYAGGVTWVGETKDEAVRMARRAAGRPLPVRTAHPPTGSRRRRSWWAVVFGTALIVAIVAALVR